MGHVRLGILPKSRKWGEVVALLTDGHASFEQIASLSAEASEKALSSLTKDPVFIEAFWMLCKIPQAARSDNFREALGNLGVHVSDQPTLPEIVNAFSKAMDNCMRGQANGRNDFAEMARNAAISSLTRMVQNQMPSLWQEHTPEDVRHALGHFTSSEHFGALAQEFYSDFTERHLRYYLDRETPKHVGADKYLPSLTALDSFNNALHNHCQEGSVIMRVFARDWYGKQYQNGEDPHSRDKVKGFTHIAMKKVKAEMKQRRNANVEA